MEEIQAAFIQQVFVQELFENTTVIEFDDDEDDFYSLSESNDLMNSIFAREISKVLASKIC